jgi:hypothetical protein
MVADILAARPPGQRQVRIINVQNLDPGEVKRVVEEVTKPRKR